MTGPALLHHSTMASRDFAVGTLAALTARSCWLVGVTTVPRAGTLGWMDTEPGYVVYDRGTGRVLTFTDVLALAGAGV